MLSPSHGGPLRSCHSWDLRSSEPTSSRSIIASPNLTGSRHGCSSLHDRSRRISWPLRLPGSPRRSSGRAPPRAPSGTPAPRRDPDLGHERALHERAARRSVGAGVRARPGGQAPNRSASCSSVRGDGSRTTVHADILTSSSQGCRTTGRSRVPIIDRMTVRRMDHVGIVVGDLPGAVAFFVTLGLELRAEAPVEGDWVDRIVGLEGVRAQIAILETSDGHGRLELSSSTPRRQTPATNARRQTLRASATSRSSSTTSTPSWRACEPTVRSWSASWCATRTATDSVTSVALRGSSSSWHRRSADGLVRRRPLDRPVEAPPTGLGATRRARRAAAHRARRASLCGRRG